MIAVVPITRVAIGFLALAACKYRFEPLDRDGSLGVDSDAAALCPVTFCDDFDRALPVELGWDAPMNSGGAMLSLSTASSVSSPQSFLVDLPAPQLEVGMLVKQLPLATTSARVSFSLAYASLTPGTAEVDLVRLRWLTLPTPCTSFGYFLVRDSTGPFDLQETYGGCGGNEDTPFDMLDNTGFHTIDMLVTFGPIGTARVRVDIDGATRVDKLTSHAIAPSTLELQVGASAVRNMAAPWQIRYDDVLVDLQ